MAKLQGKVALVTASTKGIGLEAVKALAKEGSTVYMAARSEEKANKVINEFAKENKQVKFVYFNAAEPETYISMVENVAQAEGRVDILVNNYGATDVKADKNLLEGDTETFFRILKDNVQSVYLSSKAAIPFMKKVGGGSIINISSIGSIVPDLSRTAYCVSKAAINSLTQNIALQYAKNNIRCNAILPGLIGTDAALQNMPEEFLKSFLKHVPLGRIGKPEDIANAVVYYASEESSFVTGMLHEIAGGYALGTPQYFENLT